MPCLSKDVIGTLPNDILNESPNRKPPFLIFVSVLGCQSGLRKQERKKKTTLQKKQ